MALPSLSPGGADEILNHGQTVVETRIRTLNTPPTRNTLQYVHSNSLELQGTRPPLD
jgi:hypothetical protein